MAEDSSFGIIPLRRSNEGWEIFLVKHRNGGFWGIPKGHLHSGENEKEGAARELLEETGLTVDRFLDAEPIQESYTYLKSGAAINKTVVYFMAQVKGCVCLQTEEILDGGWFPLSSAGDKLTYAEAKKVCREALSSIASFT